MPTPSDTAAIRRVVTGHDAKGKSIILSDGTAPQHHAMRGPTIGADFHEIWSDTASIPTLSARETHEPTERPFTIMPTAGHLLRLLDVYPLAQGGHRTVMHRTESLDYVVVIEGALVLILDDSEVTLRAGDVVVQRGTDHAWENRSTTVARAAFFHIKARFDATLLDTLPKPLPLMT